MDLPERFLNRMKSSLGEEYGAFLDCMKEPEIKALRLNPLKYEGELSKELSDRWQTEAVPWEKKGYYYSCQEDDVLPPGKHPLHEAGLYYIQEASAMYPVNVLDPQEGEKVLDLCAAPGGKSTQIAAHMGNTGLLVSNELIPSRALVLSSNIERMGISNTLVTNMEAEKLSAFFPAFFDRILVDAPCSGEGMFRRSDTAVENWSEENVEMCAKRQAMILDEAAKMLRPGGIMVYSTCTFAPAEDEDNIAAFLKRHDDYREILSEKLYPHRIKGEGHFVSKLQRLGGGGTLIRPKKKPQVRKYKETEEFLAAFLTDEAMERFSAERLSVFGDSIYFLPEYTPGLKGIKVLRPGLQAGVMKKDRFEPAHALAMALKAEDVRNSFNLDPEGPGARAYLSGQSVNTEGLSKDKIGDGWCLVTFGGISAGMGKKVGNMIKNHYPRGLRRNL